MAFGYCGIRVDRFAPRLAASGDRRERYFQTANTPGGHRGMKRMKTNSPHLWRGYHGRKPAVVHLKTPKTVASQISAFKQG